MELSGSSILTLIGLGLLSGLVAVLFTIHSMFKKVKRISAKKTGGYLNLVAMKIKR